MKKKNLPLIENITITSVAAEGKALTRYNDCVVFVSNCVPGDVVDLQVTKKKHNYMEARVVKFHHYSEQRTDARCKHFGQCGGCKWQILPYSEQLRYKQQLVEDNLQRIGKIKLPAISPILGSEQTYEYRNKLEFTFADRKWVSWDDIHAAGGLENIDTANALGFHIPDCFDKVLDIEECYLMPPINNQIRNFIRQYAIDNHLSFYNARAHQGLLRNLVIRSNQKGEIMLIVIFGEEMSSSARLLLESLHEHFPEITSLMYVVNTKLNDTFSDLTVSTFFGQDHLMETMEDLMFRVSPKSFYQTNTRQAYELYKVAREFASLTGKELVYDLYTGTGTIANFVARQARKVIGIEYVEQAIEDARLNSQINGIDNSLFFAGDMKDILTADFISRHGAPDVVITDPPRAGMHEDVINTILNANPERIVYVSCNPATQARDLNMLDCKYQVSKVQPVDMFPHTHHCENVVLLERR